VTARSDAAVPGVDETPDAVLSESWVRTLSLFVLLGVWQAAASTFGADTVPGPGVVTTTLLRELVAGDMAYHLGATLARVAASFCVAMAVGTAIGIVMGRYRRLDVALDGLVIVALNVPALVTIVLCYVWFGLTELAAVLAVTLNKMPTVVVMVREGARAVDRRLMDVARVYRLSRYRTLTRVYLPQLTPYLIGSARSGLALIWKIVLVVELLGRSSGVGFRISTYFQFFDIAGILAYTVAFAVIVYAIDALVFQRLDRRLRRWRA